MSATNGSGTAAAAAIKSLTHPIRLRVLRVIIAGDAKSPKQAAEALDEPLGVVSYHVRFLHRAGMLDRAGTKPRRGAVEHFYAPTDRAKRLLELLEEWV